jgi:ribosomal protein S1
MEPEATEYAYYEGGRFFKPGFGIDEWEALKQRFPVGSIITGKVVHQAVFGVFVDAGLGFPFLMHHGSFAQDTRFPDDYPPLHSELAGRILGFHDGSREIIIGPVSFSGATFR